jgi:hypothetical protein
MGNLTPTKMNTADLGRERELPSVLPADEVLTVVPVFEPLTALVVEEVQEVIEVRQRGVLAVPVAVWRFTTSTCGWVFGAVSLIVGLAFLAAIPVVQFLTLGYLLEVSGRIARTGRFHEGFIGVRLAGRAGGIILGTWLMLWPLRLISSYAVSAELIDPGSPMERGWKIGLVVATALMVVHIVAAISRGGKLRYFFWPFNPIWLARRLFRGGYYAEARDAVWDFVTALRLPYYFWLGLRGFVGAFLWLVVPVTLLAAGRRFPAVGILVATPLLMAVLLHLPFLQTQFAARGRFRSLFDIVSIWRHFLRAPWAAAFAFCVLLLFALPLYLLKIEAVPRELTWLPSVVFIVFIFPARLLVGWAFGRGERRTNRRHWFFWVTGPLPMLAVALAYVVVLFYSQYIGWEGVWNLYEQHAFLLPVPFMGM